MTNRPIAKKFQAEEWPPTRAPDSYKPRQRGKGASHDELMTFVYRVAYDFVTKTGDVFMEDWVCSDKNGAINFFERIDANVRRIRTWQGAHPDTEYVCIGGWWKDIAHNKPRRAAR